MYAKGLAWAISYMLSSRNRVYKVSKTANPYFNRYLSNVKSLFLDNSRAAPTTFTTEKVSFKKTQPFCYAEIKSRDWSYQCQCPSKVTSWQYVCTSNTPSCTDSSEPLMGESSMGSQMSKVSSGKLRLWSNRVNTKKDVKLPCTHMPTNVKS